MAKRKVPRKTSGRKQLLGKAPNPGLPDPQSVVSECEFLSPKGRRYRILKTTEKDPYDPPDQDEDDQGKKAK